MQSITKCTFKTNKSLKCLSSVLSPPDSNIEQLKKNTTLEWENPLDMNKLEMEESTEKDKVEAPAVSMTDNEHI